MTPEGGEDVGRAAGKRSATALVVAGLAIGLLMLGLGDRAYPWIKAAHVVAVISWMAGLLYLPRLFVYHCEAPKGTAQSEMLKVMERRLLLFIMVPAMVFVWVLGLWLAWNGHHWSEGWFQAKIALVIVLSGVQGYLSKAVSAFNTDHNDKPARHWRLVNEVPTLLMIGIVVLVIVKPF